MATAQDIINSSLRLIGVLASGETPSSSESDDALDVLNDMLEQWSIKKYLTYQEVTESFDLVGGTQSYTIGTGATFNTSRPNRIESAYVRLGTNDYKVKIINYDKWNSIVAKSVDTDLPYYLYYDTSYPNGTINLYPKPKSSDVDLYITTWKILSSVSTLATSLSFPPGYNMAIRYNLALLLAPEYGKTVDPGVAATASDTLENIKNLNSLDSAPDMVYNTPFNLGGSRYNINSDSRGAY